MMYQEYCVTTSKHLNNASKHFVQLRNTHAHIEHTLETIFERNSHLNDFKF